MDYFFRYKEINKIISWGKAKSLIAKYQGDILIKYPSGYINIIKDVYYIPELGINLISLDRISEVLGITTIFTKDQVFL
jgi:Uma2 family endonuclease